MSDCLIFAALFACYAVYGHAYAAGPSPADLFKLDTVALNTALLLFSSITYGFAMLCMEKGWKGNTLFWMLVTALFGMGFVYLELHEFADLIREGAGPPSTASSALLPSGGARSIARRLRSNRSRCSEASSMAQSSSAITS